ncbi:4Fe-4S dicluster domain-containing protein [Nocardioides sp. MAH-18]|uniref:4Fe-4S dicluster domain-containing protein n=1 Tax=Nocardioides agri TaxID=2682843 RepID=A0A6L6XQN0_9ACTN|nr:MULTISPECIES: heterodisulfide reductase-related iron-sulfur binding cluster [unclassified Nocardioides]MBA2954769.1 4Fe-4S dicluster domain-containing protein [Nocardioides sp. CGMCC 1.13656]MVQ49624.1 4Fe-4S dicluster domain-containing protein [Nocardioides sp. MAH-18]
MQTFAIVVSLALTAVTVVVVTLAVRQMLGVLRQGQPALARTDAKGARTATMLKETVLHTRMLQWTWIGVLHWFVFAAFIFLSTAVAAAYFQLFSPDFAWPLIGHWYPYEWFSELIGLLSTIGIIALIVYRQVKHPRRLGRGSRFFGSTQWQAYFVEYLALLEGSAILFVRAAEWRLDEEVGRSHYPISSWIGDGLYPSAPGGLENIIYGVALFKIALAMVWLLVIARNLTMGIAWHRFTAWFNIWFKREASGRTALGAVKPLTSAGKPVTLDDIEDLDEDTVLGAGTIQDFSWKGILDFTTCTECGRCQSQCPAWNTEKPLSPKLLVMGLREEAYAHAAAPAGTEPKALVGKTDADTAAGAGTDVTDWFYNPADGDFVIDEDVLWSCTSCGACVQQCPVDIEHVDHIIDMRRYQVLVESNFPAELNGLFKGLENKGNPWNMSPSARMDWAKGLDFEVKVVGETIESLDEVDWLFWVGCAGAYEDRAKKTTRAVAELLDIAGVSFGVLGNGETCTGDPARRAGNEFVFQGLAQQNAETFKEYKVKKVVSTCAHCFNTLKNEYKEFGVELEVVHHTQLLNRLVREGRLTPVQDGAGAHKRSITYHDPCYIGRHNGVYTPPRELLQVLPGAEVVEMERNSERSFCCGAGGARMWMEENLGERINLNRTKEAVATGADQIAVGCPFCRVMLSDGLTAQQAKGDAREEVEVLDVAQMLLASVKGEQATKLAPGAGAAAPAAAPAAQPVETKAEPEAGDDTITEDTVVETADAGPAAKASGGSSLFDDAGSMFDEPAATATPEKAPAEEAEAAKPASSGGSLFDLGGDEPQAEEKPAEEKEPEEKPAATGGGSLFDIAADEPTAPTEEKPAAEPVQAAATPQADLGSSGSLFDLAAPEQPEAAPAPEATAEPEPESEPEAQAEPKPEVDLGSGGSLFDNAAPAPESEPESAPEPEPQPEPTAEDEPAAAAPAAEAAPANAIPESGSLFDIAAPEPVVAPEPDAETQPEPEPASTPEPADDGRPDPAALSAAATAAASGDPEPEPEAAAEPEAEPEPQVEPEPEPEPAPEEKPKAPPAASGETHQPKADADIHGAGSLFDL